MNNEEQIGRLLGGQIRQAVESLVRTLMHPHGEQHGPNGRDPVRIPVEGLKNVQITARPAAGNTLVYVQAADEGNDYWEAGAGGGGGGKVEVVGSMFGDIVVGAATVAITNLKAAAIPYTKVKAACSPVAPTGGIGITVTVGATTHALTIAEGTAASAVTTLGSPGSWASGADVSASVTTLTGTFTGTVAFMLADGSA